jgi:hypothetical protein
MMMYQLHFAAGEYNTKIYTAKLNARKWAAATLKKERII